MSNFLLTEIPSQSLIGPTLLDYSNSFQNLELLTEATIKQLTSKKGYTGATSGLTNVDPSNIKKGFFYSMDYDFETHYPEEELAYYDKKPLILAFNHWGNYFLGLNFHFLPVLTRSWFLSRLKLTNENAFKNGGFKKLNVSYATITSIMRKSKYAVRLYKRTNVITSKAVSNNEIFELVKYSPPNYYKKTVAKVMNRYKSYP